MRIKRKPVNGREAAPPTGAAPVQAPPVESADTGRYVSKASNRILVALKPDGTVDFGKMNRDAKKQLLDVMQKKENQIAMGIGPPPAMFDPKECEYLYDAVGRFYQTIGKYLLKYPEPAQEMLLYTEGEKKALGEPTAKMLDSYAPAWLAEHQAFAAWAVVFVGITQEKFAAAGIAAKQYEHDRNMRGARIVEVVEPQVETKQ